MAAGNRGRTDLDESGTADKEKEKPLRRGRPSAGEADIRALGEEQGKKKGSRASKKNEATEKEILPRRGRSSAGEVELRMLGEASQVAMDVAGEKAGRKRGRPAAISAEEDPGGESEEQTRTKKRGRPAASRVEGQIDELSEEKTTASRRRSRRSISAVEDQAGDDLGAEDATEEPNDGSQKRSKKRGRPSIHRSEQPTNSATAPDDQVVQKRGRPAAVNTPADIVPKRPEPRMRRTRQSDAEMTEQPAEKLTTENTPARGRSRHRRSDVAEQNLSQPKQRGPGQKKAVQPDIQAEDEDVEARGRRGPRRSDVGSQEIVPKPAKKISSKPTKPNRRSEVVAVETASSKLTKIPGEKRSKPSGSSSRTKKGRSSTQTSAKAQKAARSSNATSSAPSQTHKKGPRRNSQGEARDPPRKRKAVESKFRIPPMILFLFLLISSRSRARDLQTPAGGESARA